jgi:glutathionylspermidine synthase
LHERLIEAWKRAKQVIAGDRPDAVLHVASVGVDSSVEDFITAEYLRDVALQAGWRTVPLTMSEIGWEHRRKRFIDPTGANIDFIFKLYPWEWMVREGFANNLLESPTRWFEPPWKMLLSNKALLAVLYELYPGSPYLLPTGFEPLGPTYVRKPLLSREGANIAIVHQDKVMLETEGEYDSARCVYQEFRPLPNFDGNYVVVGSWTVNGYPSGIGFREDRTLITGNMSRFLPHVIGG